MAENNIELTLENITQKMNENSDFKYLNLTRCEDKVKYRINITDENVFFEKTSEFDKDNKRILLILESPHIAEYNDKNNPVPANGITGSNIESIFGDVIKILFYDKKITEGIYDIYVMNAIQYQTSLGEDTKKHRTINFLILWHKGGKEDFENRLRKVLLDDTIIMNACTIGNKIENKEEGRNFLTKFKIKNINFSKVSLRNLVEEAIKDVTKTHNYFNYFVLSHPCRWVKLIEK